MEINREEYNWIKKPVIGLALLLYGGSIDSFGNSIKGDIYYEVGKHKVDGMTAILPTNRNQKTEFKNDIFNTVLKSKNILN